jgi:hypothetical protein
MSLLFQLTALNMRIEISPRLALRSFLKGAGAPVSVEVGRLGTAIAAVGTGEAAGPPTAGGATISPRLLARLEHGAAGTTGVAAAETTVPSCRGARFAMFRVVSILAERRRRGSSRSALMFLKFDKNTPIKAGGGGN